LIEKHPSTAMKPSLNSASTLNVVGVFPRHRDVSILLLLVTCGLLNVSGGNSNIYQYY